MTPEQWQALQDLFDRVVALPADERAAALEAPDAAPEVIAEVRRLVEQHELAGSFIESPPAAAKELRELHFHAVRRFQEGDLVAGRFEIREPLGQGGMGAVYEAFDRDMSECVALKTIRPDLASDERLMAALIAEVQAARKVTHPNVCRVYDLGRFDDGGAAGLFLTMELLKGETLAARIHRNGPIAQLDAMPILRQIAMALDAAHQAGVVHRDLKPANVILTPTAGGTRVVVTDFGLARVTSS